MEVGGRTGGLESQAGPGAGRSSLSNVLLPMADAEPEFDAFRGRKSRADTICVGNS